MGHDDRHCHYRWGVFGGRVPGVEGQSPDALVKELWSDMSLPVMDYIRPTLALLLPEAQYVSAGVTINSNVVDTVVDRLCIGNAAEG